MLLYFSIILQYFIPLLQTLNFPAISHQVCLLSTLYSKSEKPHIFVHYYVSISSCNFEPLVSKKLLLIEIYYVGFFCKLS